MIVAPFARRAFAYNSHINPYIDRERERKKYFDSLSHPPFKPYSTQLAKNSVEKCNKSMKYA